ncbi:MAG: hypothetical protein M0Z65_11240 [Firmicutes bacterium]|nr:hypothetical protein [Bacillota bacterium]
MSQERKEDSTHEQVDWMVDEGLGADHTGRDSGVVKKTDPRVIRTHPEAQRKDVEGEGNGRYWMDVDRMVNEGLGGGHVGEATGKIDESPPLRSKQRPADTEG